MNLGVLDEDAYDAKWTVSIITCPHAIRHEGVRRRGAVIKDIPEIRVSRPSLLEICACYSPEPTSPMTVGRKHLTEQYDRVGMQINEVVHGGPPRVHGSRARYRQPDIEQIRPRTAQPDSLIIYAVQTRAYVVGQFAC